MKSLTVQVFIGALLIAICAIAGLSSILYYGVVTKAGGIPLLLAFILFLAILAISSMQVLKTGRMIYDWMEDVRYDD